MINYVKKVNVLAVLLLAIITSTLFVGCNIESNSSSGAKEQEFLTIVKESQSALDTLGDEIYSCWYDAIYKDKYSGNIDKAILYAYSNCSDEVSLIESNDEKLRTIYKSVKDGKLSEEVKDVMSAYTDYYEFVYNVSGSFNSFSANKEILKKDFASAIKKLELEV